MKKPDLPNLRSPNGLLKKWQVKTKIHLLDYIDDLEQQLDTMERKWAKSVVDMTALDGCWEKKVECLKKDIEMLKQELERKPNNWLLE